MTLPTATYIVHTTTRTVTLTASIRVDEYGYFFTDDDDRVVLHIAHGFLTSIEPASPAVSDKASEARRRLKGQ